MMQHADGFNAVEAPADGAELQDISLRIVDVA
jgi:hypothetical protein